MTDPIEFCAGKAAATLKQWSPDIQLETDVMRYWIAYWLNFYGVLAVSLLIGWISGAFPETVTTLVAFGMLRRFSGGAHLPTLTLCAVVSITLLTTLAHVRLSLFYTQLFNILALMLILFFCKRRGIHLLISILLVVSNLFLALSPAALAFFSQGVSLINKRR